MTATVAWTAATASNFRNQPNRGGDALARFPNSPDAPENVRWLGDVPAGRAGYGTAMTAARVHDDGSAMAADAMQAAYFRGCLAGEREQIAGHVGKHREELGHRFDVGSLAGTSHLRSQVRSLEAEIRYLDSLIAKLDRRFAALWAARD